MALNKLESAIRNFIGNQDPEKIEASLLVKYENLDGLDVLRFVLSSGAFGEIPQTHNFYNGINPAEALDTLYNIGRQVQASGIRCKLIIGFTAEPVMLEAKMKYPELIEFFGSSRDDGKAEYELSPELLSAVRRSFVRP